MADHRQADIRKKLHELKRDSGRRWLEFLGIDVQKLWKIEKEMGKQYGDLAQAMRRLPRGGLGRSRSREAKADQPELPSRRHKWQDTRSRAVFRSGSSALTARGSSGLRLANDTPYHWVCDRETFVPFTSRREGEVVLVDPTDIAPAPFDDPNDPDVYEGLVRYLVDDAGVAEGSATYHPTLAKAYPVAMAHVHRTTETLTIEATTRLRFAVNLVPPDPCCCPEDKLDGPFCIRPHIMMCGYWVALPYNWGGGCGGGDPTGTTASVKIEVGMEVDQPVWTAPITDHDCDEDACPLYLDESYAGAFTGNLGIAEHGEFDYDSDAPGNKWPGVKIGHLNLDVTHEVVVDVWCKVTATAENNALAWVIMRPDAPNPPDVGGYGFHVPEVWVERCHKERLQPAVEAIGVWPSEPPV